MGIGPGGNEPDGGESKKTASQAHSGLVANMGHELRSPLNAIIGFTDLILDREFGDLTPSQDEYLRDVLQNARHMLGLIEDIVDLSKVEDGNSVLQPSEVRLIEILSRSQIMIKEKALKRGIRLTADIKGLPEVITADERKLKHILFNLLSNALESTPEDGEVGLKAKMDGEMICISVENTGLGLNKPELMRIFKQVDHTDYPLGHDGREPCRDLCLTSKLVELHGGRIWAESEGEDRGAVIHFLIPPSADFKGLEF
jgi:signal transduction histidine kinase